MPEALLNYLQLVRAPAVFTALSNIVAAQLIVTRGHPDWATVGLLGLASMALYMAGMVLNDCFDYQEDLRERPARPLPSGRIPLRSAWILGWGLLGLGILLAAPAGSTQLLIATLLAGAIVLYDGLAKHGPLGPPVMGGCRYLNWLLGLSIAGMTGEAYALALPIFLYVVSISILSVEETRAKNRPVAYGSGLALLLCAVTIAVFHWIGLLPRHGALAPFAAALAYLVWRQMGTLRQFTPERIQGMIRTMILGIIPLDALLVLSAAPWWAGALVASLLIPGWLLARRMRVT